MFKQICKKGRDTALAEEVPEMADRRSCITTLIVAILMAATGFVVHMVDVFRMKTPAHQQLMLEGAAVGSIVVIGILLLVVFGWLMGFCFTRKQD